MIKQNFNRNWFFRDGCRDVFADLLKRDEAGCSITLPHDASIGRPRDAGVINGAANGYYQEGNYTYRKEFVIEEEHKEKNIYFEFEGVYQNAFVYINRSFAGKCPYGYSNFYIDATKYIRFGRRNVIEVQVKNAVPSSRWYTGGGIYRDVNIMIADRMHFTEKGVRLTTVSLEKDLAVIDVEPEIEYTGTGVRSVVCRCRLYDADGLPERSRTGKRMYCKI